MPRRFSITLPALLCMALALCGCNDNRKEYRLEGRTMGTSYSVRFVLEPGVSLQAVSQRITHELEAVNSSMSVFDAHSELSRFNALSAAETQREPFAASVAFYALMTQARDLYDLTSGAWDGTVMPLVNLWGFGPEGSVAIPPSPEAVAAVLSDIGFDKIMLGPTQTLIKKDDISVDLASIAKGYGVDRIAKTLTDLGLQSFLVEIGGEVYAKGLKLNGQKWRVGINCPDVNSLAGEIYAVTELKDRALATSGNYRNFFVANGKTYAHIIDPRTGYPATTDIASVSVITSTCAKADGLATAMVVLSVEQSLELANADPDVEVLIITREASGVFVNHLSQGMANYLASDTP